MIEIAKTKLDRTDWFEKWFDGNEGNHAGKYEMRDPDNTTWWTAWDGDRLVGVCAAEQRSEHVWYMFGGIVDEEYRRRGIYREMFKQRYEFIVEHNPLVILSLSSPGNRELFRKYGFTDVLSKEWDEDYSEVFFFKDFK